MDLGVAVRFIPFVIPRKQDSKRTPEKIMYNIPESGQGSVMPGYTARQRIALTDDGYVHIKLAAGR